jgi:ABC-type multidrug transport system ATPase subunit
LLRVDGLSKEYAPPPPWLRPLVRVAGRVSVPALRDVSFEVRPGEVVGLVGANGAGKTTIFKIVGTLVEPTSGRAFVDGIDVVADPLQARRRLALILSDERGLYWRLTGRQNLEFFAVLRGIPRPAARIMAAELLERVGLAEVDKLVFGYSSGMRTRLNLARGLLGDPGLLLLDEPTRSLDTVASAAVGHLLVDLAAEGRAILFSSHRLDEIAGLCQSVVVLVEGKVRHIGPVRELGPSPDGAAQALAALLAREPNRS